MTLHTATPTPPHPNKEHVDIREQMKVDFQGPGQNQDVLKSFKTRRSIKKLINLDLGGTLEVNLYRVYVRVT